MLKKRNCKKINQMLNLKITKRKYENSYRKINIKFLFIIFSIIKLLDKNVSLF